MFSSQGAGVSTRRDEIDRVVHDVDDVLVGADAVERRDLVGRQLVVGDLQPPAGVREADHAPLRLAPLEHRQVPARPFLDPGRARVVVFLEPQQAEVAGVRRREARDLDVVAHQVVGVESGWILPSKNCFWAYQHGPQDSTQPTSRSSPRMCRLMSSGFTPSVGLS